MQNGKYKIVHQKKSGEETTTYYDDQDVYSTHKKNILDTGGKILESVEPVREGMKILNEA